jgi:hypothetical protein
MKVAALCNENDEYVTEEAVEVLYTELCRVLTSWEKKEAAMQLVSECRWGSADKLIAAAAAAKEGFIQSKRGGAQGGEWGRGRIGLGRPRPRRTRPQHEDCLG